MINVAGTLHHNREMDVRAEAELMLTSPWSLSLERKMQLIGLLAEEENSQALRILLSVLNQLDLPVARPRKSNATSKYGGGLVNAAVEAIASMALPGAFDSLEEIYQNENHMPVLRASIVWGIRLTRLPRAEQILVDALSHDAELVQVAAIDALEFRYRLAPREMDRDILFKAREVAIQLYLTGQERTYRRQLIRFLKIQPAGPVFRLLDEMIVGVENASILHRAIELAVLLRSDHSDLFMMRIFSRVGLQSSVYKVISRILSSSKVRPVIEQAQVLMRGPGLQERVRAWVSPVIRRSIEERTKGARSICGY